MKWLPLTLVAFTGAGVSAAGPPDAMIIRYTAAQLGGIATLFRYQVTRPDRAETRFVFLSPPDADALPEEVQVVGPDGATVTLSNIEGADCTLSHVEIVTGPRPAVVSAVRVFFPKLEDNDLSRPAPMDIQVYRPAAGDDAGESTILLRASGAPVRSRALCNPAEMKRIMLSQANAR